MSRSAVLPLGSPSHGRGERLARVTLRVQEDLRGDLETLADGRPLSVVVREAMIEYVEARTPAQQ